MTNTVQSGNGAEEHAGAPGSIESIQLLVSIFDSMNVLYANLKKMEYRLEKHRMAENNSKKSPE